MPERKSDKNIKRFFDLEQAVEDYGRKLFAKNARTRKQKRLRKKHFEQNIPCIDVQIDWSHLSITHETRWSEIKDEDFKPIQNPGGAVASAGDRRAGSPRAADVKSADVNVLFQTDFTNDTSEKQEYTLKIEKTTRSTLTTEIEHGVTNGMELAATLSIGDVVELGAGYSREVSLTKMEGETMENEVTWGAESTIVVPGKKSASAEMQVLEKKQSGDFTVYTTMAGYVKIKYYALKDKSLLFSQTGKIKVVVDDFVNEIRSEGKEFKGIDYGQENSVIFQTAGKCNFRFGVKQIIKVNQDST